MTNSPARLPGPARPRAPYSSELGETICDRIAAGLSLASICRRKGMPPRSTVERWTRIHPEFGEAFGLALAAGGGPRRGGRRSDYSLDMAVAVCARVADGEALHRVCAEPGMPAQVTVFRWLSRYPEFAAMLRLAREVQAQRLFDEVREIADGATAASLSVDRARISVRQWQAARLAPKKFGPRPAEDGDDSAGSTFNVEVVRFGPFDPTAH